MTTQFPLPGGALGEPPPRRPGFVGRAAVRELFRAALRSPDPAGSVLFIHGPGGIGKTSLLAVLGELSEQHGARVVRLDGRELSPSEGAVREVLDGLIGPAPDPAGRAPPGQAPPPDRAPPAGRVVLLLDAYERLAPLDGWLRSWLVPRLPAGTLTVIAARTAPGAGWRADPAGRGRLQVASLRNLDPGESRDYLVECGIPAAAQDRLLQVSHGHPLSLALLADIASRGGSTTVDALSPDLVGTLVRQFVDVVASPTRRSALGVCALARVTTPEMLQDVLKLAPEEARELFGWLASLSFVERAPAGASPHDLARDVLDVDLRWRDPEGYQHTFRAVRSHIHRGLTVTRGRDQQRAVYDEKYLFRNLPSILSPLDLGRWGWLHPEPARPDDHGLILGLVQAWEGTASAAIAEHWLARQPAGFFVLRRESGTVDGLLGLLDLTAASAADRAADPGARAAWEYAARHAPVRPGETVLQSRFILDRSAYQAPSATLNAAPVLTIQRYLQTRNLAWDFLTLAEPERWDPYFAAADLPRAAGADFVVDGRRFGLFAHDFRRVPVDDWMALVTERALAQDFTLPPRNPPEVLVPSRAELADAVRQALGDLRRPDLLGRNPLLRTRLLRQHAGSDEPDGSDLAALLHEAVAGLRGLPGQDRLFPAVDRAHLRPAAYPQAVAGHLGPPLDGHLTDPVDRIVAWFWEREVQDPTGADILD